LGVGLGLGLVLGSRIMKISQSFTPPTNSPSSKVRGHPAGG
jgi:hypothetical protein